MHNYYYVRVRLLDEYKDGSPQEKLLRVRAKDNLNAIGQAVKLIRKAGLQPRSMSVDTKNIIPANKKRWR